MPEQEKPSYIIDFYAFLKVDSDAELKTVRSAVRRMLANHPDNVSERLDDRVKDEARFVYDVAQKADAVFRTEETRAAYDEDLASYPSNLRSRDGRAIEIVGSRSTFAFLDTNELDDAIKRYDHMVNAMAPANEAGVKMLLRAYENDANPDDETREAVAEALRVKSIHFERKAVARGDALGVAAAAIEGSFDFAELEQAVKTAKTERKDELQALTNGTQHLEIRSGAGTTNTKVDLVPISSIEKQIEFRSQELLALAKDHQAAYEKRLEILDGKYLTNPDLLSEQLVIHYHSAQVTLVMSFSFDGATLHAEQTDMADSFNHTAPTPEQISQLEADGVSLLDVIADSERKPMDQIGDVLERHMDKVVAQQLGKETGPDLAL